MGQFRLSTHSIDKLSGVKRPLIEVVTYAITVTKIDFGITEGVRSIERQRELFKSGASQVAHSKHLDGSAIDLIAYLDGRASWELPLYDDLADAMRLGAIRANVGIRWGGAWTVPDIRQWQGPMERAMLSYIDQRRKEGRRPFIDAPHFELV